MIFVQRKTAVIFIACFLISGCSPLIDQRIDATSPDGRYIASAFRSNGGATVDYSPQVEVRLNGKPLGERGNVFKGYHGLTDVLWESNTNLIIFCEDATRIDSSKKQWQDVSITIRRSSNSIWEMREKRKQSATTNALKSPPLD